MTRRSDEAFEWFEHLDELIGPAEPQTQSLEESLSARAGAMLTELAVIYDENGISEDCYERMQQQIVDHFGTSVDEV